MAHDERPDRAKDAVEAVMDVLGQRKGFRWWWDDVDQVIQDEIQAEAAENVGNLLAEGAAFPQVAPVPAGNYEQEVDAEFAKLHKLEDQRASVDAALRVKATLSAMEEQEARPDAVPFEFLLRPKMHGLFVEAAFERARQVAQGATPEHDDQFAEGDLAAAASCYAVPARLRYFGMIGGVPWAWPLPKESWQPTEDDRRRELVKAAALLLAEWDRLDRDEAQG